MLDSNALVLWKKFGFLTCLQIVCYCVGCGVNDEIVAQPLLCLPVGTESWVGHKVHSGFAVTACLKNQTNFLASPVVYQRGSVCNVV